MVEIKPFVFRKPTNNKKLISRLSVGTIVLGGIAISSCGGSSNDGGQLTPTQGVITYMEETDTNKFQITDEVIVDRKSQSKIITTNLDGTIDTMSVGAALRADTTTTRGRSYRRTYYGGMFGYIVGRNMGSPLNRSSYSNSSAYGRSNTRSSGLKSTSFRPSVSKPTSGFGSGKSFRSFGG